MNKIEQSFIQDEEAKSLLNFIENKKRAFELLLKFTDRSRAYKYIDNDLVIRELN